MKYLVTSKEMRMYDTNTIEKIGIPEIVLMERAALAALEAVERYCVLRRKEQNLTALILAGTGNNGGDGLALARLMSERDFKVEIWCVGDRKKASKQWTRQREILEHYPVEFVTEPLRMEYTIMIDALFGVGITREITGLYRDAVERFSELAGYRLALDMPSGVDSDTGKLWGAAVNADETITFGFCKRGLVLYPGCEYAGKVTVADIGISERSFCGSTPGLFAWDEEPGMLLPARRGDGNKGTFGKVLLLAGGPNMAGAAVLAARAAYRSGAGMVKVVTRPENRVILQTAVPEALLGAEDGLDDDLEWADVLAVGPGIGKGDHALQLLNAVVTRSEKPLLIDADGLNLLASRPELAGSIREQGISGRRFVLTPHVGELSRLTGKPAGILKENLAYFGRELAKELRAVVVAKDARTFICAAEGPLCVNLSGNCGMATAGSGDVLAGVIAGLMAQGMEPFQAATVGAYIHGIAGDIAVVQCGEHACTALDIVDGLKQCKDFG